VVDGVDGVRTAVHVCRGNWSRREEVLLSGDYEALLPCFKQMKVDQLVLEYATPRAGDIDIVGRALGDRQIGLGVVNPRTDEAESVQQITAQVERALRYWKPEQILLNPDCGFGCFANRCVNEADNAGRKLDAMVAASRSLRERFL
jgi:5-methyltetrahydropteroyltriglutamate--homocysteine methyltransferase